MSQDIECEGKKHTHHHSHKLLHNANSKFYFSFFWGGSLSLAVTSVSMSVALFRNKFWAKNKVLQLDYIPWRLRTIKASNPNFWKRVDKSKFDTSQSAPMLVWSVEKAQSKIFVLALGLWGERNVSIEIWHKKGSNSGWEQVEYTLLINMQLAWW